MRGQSRQSAEPDGARSPDEAGARASLRSPDEADARASLRSPDDVPRLPIEHLMAQLVDQASEIISAQDRLRTLLRANRSIVSELSLSGVLRRIVEAARDVSGARYAALGVVSPQGLLEQFIHVGMDEETVAAIGPLPEGRGVLGTLIEHPEPIRVGNLASDPRSAGFPPHHPPMTTFLGVPVRSHNEVFGNLYLTDRRGGGEFTAEDEEFVLALAATASIAIENARLYEESRQRQEWLRASGEISRRLLDPESSPEESLRRIAESVSRLADADLTAIVLPTEDPERLVVAVAAGADEQCLTGRLVTAADTLPGAAMRAGHGLLLDPSRTGSPGDGAGSPRPPWDAGAGPLMALPLAGEGMARGAIVASRAPGRRPFGSADLDMAESFANHAAIALELSDARHAAERLVVLEDRDRIARDLHDLVIQRVFATGLSVQGAATLADTPELRNRLSHAVDDLDDTIRQIRTSIFELQDDAEASLRGAVLAVVHELGPLLPAPPTIRFSGPLDTVADGTLVADAGAVVRETLTNVVKHARAPHTSIEVTATSQRLSVCVADDGVGLPVAPQLSGLDNLRQRAERRGGALDVTCPEPTGTTVRWTVPLAP